MRQAMNAYHQAVRIARRRRLFGRDACVCVMGVSVDPLAFVSNAVAQCLNNVAAWVRELSWLSLRWARPWVCYYSSVYMVGRADRVFATPATRTFYVCLVVYEAGHDYRSKDHSAARSAVPV